MGQLIDHLSGAVAPADVAALARLLGDTPDATDAALRLAAPALLAGLANRAAHGGMDEVMALAGPLLADGNPLDRLHDALADSSVRARLLEQGHGLLDGLLGAGAGRLAAALSSQTGTRAHTVAEVLKLAGPAGLGAIARRLEGHVTADRLAALLAAERPALLAALPAGLAAEVAATEAEPVPLHGTAVEGAAGAARSAGRWLPWLAAAVVGIVVVAGFRGFDGGAGRLGRPAATTAIITEGPVPLSEARLPDGSVLMLPEGSAALELAQALSAGESAVGRRFRLADAGWSVAAGRIEGAGAETVHAVASVLKAWPGVQVRIEGHGDGSGDEGQSLAESTARAQAVAGLLAEDGVLAANLSAQGLGNAEPIATVETDEGRAQNRRTLVIVTAA